LLQSSLTATQPSQLEQAGIIQFYEMAFELAWKTLEDNLQEHGFEVPPLGKPPNKAPGTDN